MALPTQLQSARMTGSTLGKDIPANIGALEQALCDIFGFTINVNVTESPIDSDNAGIIAKALMRQKAAAPTGWRFKDATGGKEVRLVNDGTYLSIDQNTGTEGTPIWTNWAKMDIATGIFTFVAIPVGPDADPTQANEFTRKSYVDQVEGVMVQKVNYQTAETAYNTAAIPGDNTKPQKTEGHEYYTLAITPVSATNNLKIDVIFNVSGVGVVILALFQDDLDNALSCTFGSMAGFSMLSISHTMVAGTTSEITFKVRAGSADGSAIQMNGYGGFRYGGGVMFSSITVTEIKP